MPTFFEERRPHEGLTYREFETEWRERAKRPTDDLDTSARRRLVYFRYNLERSEQVFARYEPSGALKQAVDGIEAAQLWMVLTEAWCGDSAYCLPVLVEAASLSELVELRVLHRDENLDIMEQYLTNGTRGIPKLVAFGGDGTQLFEWGPRPAQAQKLRDRIIAEGGDKAQAVDALLDWYAEGGWNDVDRELTDALARVTV